MPTLTPTIIAAAIRGFEQNKLEIDAKIAELRALLQPTPISVPAPAVAPVVEAPTKRKRKMSASARKRIGEAQKKRWATYYAAHPKKKAKAA
jgi:hypothetical protein